METYGLRGNPNQVTLRVNTDYRWVLEFSVTSEPDSLPAFLTPKDVRLLIGQLTTWLAGLPPQAPRLLGDYVGESPPQKGNP